MKKTFFCLLLFSLLCFSATEVSSNETVERTQKLAEAYSVASAGSGLLMLAASIFLFVAAHYSYSKFVHSAREDPSVLWAFGAVAFALLGMILFFNGMAVLVGSVAAGFFKSVFSHSPKL